MTPFIRLHPADDVLIARAQLVGGTQVENITVRGLIPAGHKIATRALAAGEPVRRYNQIIGFASKPIAPGEHVHTHNLDMGPDKGDFARDYAFGADVKPAPARREATFMGIKRPTDVWPRATTSGFSRASTVRPPPRGRFLTISRGGTILRH
jgi:altronate hydrolase